MSAIIVFKNAEKFIREAVDSVCAQTYVTGKLARRRRLIGCRARSLWIRAAVSSEGRYLEYEGHATRTSSRNVGARHAAGEYLAFLDADDVWLPQKLERQVSPMRANPRAGMIYGDSLYWYGWTGRAEDAARDYLPPLRVEPDTLAEAPQLLIQFIRNVAFIPCPCSIMVRSDVLSKVGGFEDEFCRVTRGMYEDQAFYAKVTLEWPVYVSGECWDKYRRHDDSACAQEKKTGDYFTSHLTYLNWFEGYLIGKGVRGGAVWRALQHELLAIGVCSDFVLSSVDAVGRSHPPLRSAP